MPTSRPTANKSPHLWVVDAVSGTDQQLTSGDDWNDNDPQWSPDSTRIAFVSNRTGKEFDGHNKDVWVTAAGGGALTKISDHEFDDTMPRWSPDGSQIAFAGQTARRQFPKLYVASSAVAPIYVTSCGFFAGSISCMEPGTLGACGIIDAISRPASPVRPCPDHPR